MLFLKHSDLNWNYSLKHDMQSGVHNDLPSNLSADVIFARIESGHTLSKHYHQRPLDIDGKDNGYESFFFFDGGHILLIGENYEKEICCKEPFTLTFFSGKNEAHGIKNLGKKDVEFQVICAPKFDSSEEYFI